MDLGKAICELRKSRNLTQADLAKKCKRSIQTICNVETGKNAPTDATIDKICRVLKYPKSYIFLYALTEDDIPAKKREMFNIMKNFLIGC